jgi:cadherin-related family protein 4
MGASSLSALLLIDLHSLPWFVNVSERQGPGTIIQFFSFNCTSYVPTLELLSVQPNTTFFNKPSLAGQQGIYVGQVESCVQLETVGAQGEM